MTVLSPEDIAKLPSSKIGIRVPLEDLRREVQQIADKIRALNQGSTPTVQAIDKIEHRNEAIANVMIAYRHLEDAKMRLGKVIQAADEGISILDR